MEQGRHTNSMRIGNNYIGLTLQAFNPKYQLTLIEWTLEMEAGWFTTSFTVCNLQVVFELALDRATIARWNARLEESQKEFENGDYYFFVHNKNPLLKEFGEYMEANEGLRFWQALTAWTGKDITVGGEDPFYWTNKLQ